MFYWSLIKSELEKQLLFFLHNSSVACFSVNLPMPRFSQCAASKTFQQMYCGGFWDTFVHGLKKKKKKAKLGHETWSGFMLLSDKSSRIVWGSLSCLQTVQKFSLQRTLFSRNWKITSLWLIKVQIKDMAFFFLKKCILPKNFHTRV